MLEESINLLNMNSIWNFGGVDIKRNVGLTLNKLRGNKLEELHGRVSKKWGLVAPNIVRIPGNN